MSEYSSPNLSLGMSPVEFGAGTSQWAWSKQPPQVLNPFGTLAGGYLTIFIDELLSTAIASVLKEDEWAMTAELKVSFLRALKPGFLEGNARVLRSTRSLAFLEAHITTADKQLAVAASSTWAVLRS